MFPNSSPIALLARTLGEDYEFHHFQMVQTLPFFNFVSEIGELRQQ